MQAWMWIAAGGALIAFELATTNLVLASLGVSAIAAAVANLLGADVLWQAIVFALAAAATLGVVRPIAMRNLHRRPAGLTTNVDRLLQSEGLALTEVNERSGQVKLLGEVWTARTRHGVVAADQPVHVVAIEGAIAIVQAKEVR